jgi:hypothetical protein
MYKKFFKSLFLFLVVTGYLFLGFVVSVQEISAEGDLVKDGLSINISADKRVYRSGEPIKLNIEFKNIDKKRLCLLLPAKRSVPKNLNVSKKYWDSLCLLSQDKISLAVERVSTSEKSPFIGSPFTSPIKPVRVKLKRGETHYLEISDVSMFYEITKLGSFYIVLKYSFAKEKRRHGGIWTGEIYSNIIKIRIKK